MLDTNTWRGALAFTLGAAAYLSFGPAGFLFHNALFVSSLLTTIGLTVLVVFDDERINYRSFFTASIITSPSPSASTTHLHIHPQPQPPSSFSYDTPPPVASRPIFVQPPADNIIPPHATITNVRDIPVPPISTLTGIPSHAKITKVHDIPVPPVSTLTGIPSHAKITKVHDIPVPPVSTLTGIPSHAKITKVHDIPVSPVYTPKAAFHAQAARYPSSSISTAPIPGNASITNVRDIPVSRAPTHTGIPSQATITNVREEPVVPSFSSFWSDNTPTAPSLAENFGVPAGATVTGMRDENVTKRYNKP